MVHGDDSGLVLPPAIAPVEVMIIPIMQKKEGVLEKAAEIKKELSEIARVKVDDSDKSPGWKFAEHEMKGVPLRVEIGPKDIEKNQAVIVRRDNREKFFVSLDDLKEQVQILLKTMQKDLLEKARNHRDTHTYVATDMVSFEKTLKETPGFIKAMWCGDPACEEKIKETTGATSRCMPFDQEKVSDTCVCCGKASDTLVYWGRAY
jgi:prolyl-tRNA synthetase